MKKITLILTMIGLVFSANLIAQRTTDVEGSKDYPTISRFKGAVIEFYKETKWGSYKLPVSDKGTIDWEKPMALDGKITRIQYTVSNDNNSEFVLHNYKAGFTKSGYNIMIAIANEELGVSDRPHTWRAKYYTTDGYYDCLYNDKFGIGIDFPSWKNDHSFIAARGHEDGKDIYAVIYIVVDDNYTLITQDVIEVEAVETGLVSVDNISGDITKKGHIAIYGIHFETGKSSLKSESENALKTVSEYINSHPDKNFYIVGHTDNTGDFAANMTLSENRAKTVVNDLTTRYNVDIKQLKAYGVSSLVPVYSNATEEGKLKNRRVEIVEQ